MISPELMETPGVSAPVSANNVRSLALLALSPRGLQRLLCLDDLDGLVELEGQDGFCRHFDRATLGQDLR
jgi:hypothetical protein